MRYGTVYIPKGRQPDDQYPAGSVLEIQVVERRVGWRKKRADLLQEMRPTGLLLGHLRPIVPRSAHSCKSACYRLPCVATRRYPRAVPLAFAGSLPRCSSRTGHGGRLARQLAALRSAGSAPGDSELPQRLIYAKLTPISLETLASYIVVPPSCQGVDATILWLSQRRSLGRREDHTIRAGCTPSIRRHRR